MILLYVDDSKTMQKVAEYTFAGSELEYVAAWNAEDALRVAEERRPSVVLIDAVIPGADTYELCAKLRALLPEAPILIVCGNSEPYDAERGARAGANGTIAKPWDTELTINLVTNHVKRGPAAITRPARPSTPPPTGRYTPLPAPAAPPPSAPPPVSAPKQASVMGMPEIKLPEVAAEAPKEPDKPLYVDENVQFTIYRPKAMPPAKWHPLLAFAHLAEKRDDEDDESDPIEEVQRQARQVLGDDADKFTDTTQDATAAIPAEGELTITPHLPGFDVNPKARTFLWTESVHREEFRIRAPASLDGQTVRGKVTVWLGSLIVAEVPLAIRVSAGAGDSDAKPAPAKARPYRKIFASYSHRDAHVVDEVSRLARALGDEYIRDWVHLRTGQVWNDQLRTLIAEADIFQLFWSSNSMQSKFCREEWEYALSLGRPTFVRPTYWEDPLPRDEGAGLPPDELVRLHFQKIRVGTEWSPPPKVAEAKPAEAKPDAASEPEKPGARDLGEIKARLGLKKAGGAAGGPAPSGASPPGAAPSGDEPFGAMNGMASAKSSAPVIVENSEPREANRRSSLIPILALVLLVIAAIVGWLVLR